MRGDLSGIVQGFTKAAYMKKAPATAIGAGLGALLGGGVGALTAPEGKRLKRGLIGAGIGGGIGGVGANLAYEPLMEKYLRGRSESARVAFQDFMDAHPEPEPPRYVDKPYRWDLGEEFARTEPEPELNPSYTRDSHQIAAKRMGLPPPPELLEEGYDAWKDEMHPGTFRSFKSLQKRIRAEHRAAFDKSLEARRDWRARRDAWVEAELSARLEKYRQEYEIPWDKYVAWHDQFGRGTPERTALSAQVAARTDELMDFLTRYSRAGIEDEH